jgi:hypothetical protein
MRVEGSAAAAAAAAAEAPGVLGAEAQLKAAGGGAWPVSGAQAGQSPCK